MSSKQLVAIGLGSDIEDSFVFGVQYTFTDKEINYDKAYHEKDEFEYAPIKSYPGRTLVRVVKTDQYFIGSDYEVKEFVNYIKEGQFGDSCHAFDGEDIYEDNILTKFSLRDLLVLGYHIEWAYGDCIDVYYKDHTNDMFVHIQHITPGSEHIIHFFNKHDVKLFANFMNRYGYVNF